jgi:mercuric ion transport protein
MKLFCKNECIEKNTPKANNGLTFISGLVLTLMPKCAMCWAAYMNLFSFLGLSKIKYHSWYLPLGVILFLLTLIKFLRTAMLERTYLDFSLAVIAGILIIFQKYKGPIENLDYLIISLMAIAVFRTKISNYFSRTFLNSYMKLLWPKIIRVATRQRTAR